MCKSDVLISFQYLLCYFHRGLLYMRSATEEKPYQCVVGAVTICCSDSDSDSMHKMFHESARGGRQETKSAS